MFTSNWFWTVVETVRLEKKAGSIMLFTRTCSGIENKLVNSKWRGEKQANARQQRAWKSPQQDERNRSRCPERGGGLDGTEAKPGGKITAAHLSTSYWGASCSGRHKGIWGKTETRKSFLKVGFHTLPVWLQMRGWSGGQAVAPQSWARVEAALLAAMCQAKGRCENVVPRERAAVMVSVWDHEMEPKPARHIFGGGGMYLLNWHWHLE